MLIRDCLSSGHGAQDEEWLNIPKQKQSFQTENYKHLDSSCGVKNANITGKVTFLCAFVLLKEEHSCETECGLVTSFENVTVKILGILKAGKVTLSVKPMKQFRESRHNKQSFLWF